MADSCSVSFSTGKEVRGLFHRHAADLADILAGDLHLLRFDSQAGSAAGGAGRVSPITAEKYANMQFVFLAFEMIEEAAHAPKLCLRRR